jgi:hypothetical protein
MLDFSFEPPSRHSTLDGNGASTMARAEREAPDFTLGLGIHGIASRAKTWMVPGGSVLGSSVTLITTGRAKFY